jgi:hypothetical protein
MAEKIGFRDVKKGNFGKQMEFRKKSNLSTQKQESEWKEGSKPL